MPRAEGCAALAAPVRFRNESIVQTTESERRNADFTAARGSRLNVDLTDSNRTSTASGDLGNYEVPSLPAVDRVRSSSCRVEFDPLGFRKRIDCVARFAEVEGVWSTVGHDHGFVIAVEPHPFAV